LLSQRKAEEDQKSEEIEEIKLKLKSIKEQVNVVVAYQL
jgi:hypothetical protein